MSPLPLIVKFDAIRCICRFFWLFQTVTKKKTCHFSENSLFLNDSKIFRWVFRKIKNGIGRAIDYVSSGEMAGDRKRCKYKAWKRRQKKLDAALKDGSVDHDTYVRAQIWLEKIRDWDTSNERLKRDP